MQRIDSLSPHTTVLHSRPPGEVTCDKDDAAGLWAILFGQILPLKENRYSDQCIPGILVWIAPRYVLQVEQPHYKATCKPILRKLNAPGVQDLFTVVAVEVTKRLSGASAVHCSRQHLANTVWAYATLDHSGGSLFLGKVAAALTKRAGECNPQEISNTVWAYAKLRELLNELLPGSINNVMNVQSLLTKLFRTHLQGHDHVICRQDLHRCDMKISLNQCTTFMTLKGFSWKFRTRGRSSKLRRETINYCYSLHPHLHVTAGHYDAPLLERMADEADTQIANFSQQNLANLAWAYGKLSHYKPSLMASVAHQAVLKVKVISCAQQ